MAEGTTEESSNSWESWLGGWVQAAKETSTSALEFVKKDLAEFSTCVQKETEKAIEKTSLSLSKENTEQATSKVKAGITSFLGNISKALVIPPSDDYVPVRVSADGTTLYDRGKARLHAIQLDASTYVDPPRGPHEQFEMWLNSFDMDQHKGEVSEILVSRVEVRALYTKLVPNDVSHAEFWQRYFYRVHQLECDEERKKALMQRAERSRGDSLSWDDDDWSGGEDDDDGNQSDWEKMPRPQQQKSSAHTPSRPEESTPEPFPTDPTPSSTHNSTDEANLKKDSAKSVTDKDNVNSETKHHQDNDISPPPNKDSDAVSCDKDSTHGSELQPVHDHFSVDSPQSCQAEASHHEQPEAPVVHEADPVPEVPPPNSSQSSVETASASSTTTTPKKQQPYLEPGSAEMPLGDDVHAEESRTPADPFSDHQVTPSEVMNAAAASGVELSPPVGEIHDVAGDAACGASEVVLSSPPTPSRTAPAPQDSSDPSLAVSDDASSTSKNTLPNLQSEMHQASRDAACISSDNGPERVESTTDHHGRMEATAQEVTEKTASHPSETEKSGDDIDIAMRVKGDMVMVGETCTSSDSSEPKDLGLEDDDWDEDFDVELTEEDLKAAEDIAKKMGENLDIEEDDWESWD